MAKRMIFLLLVFFLLPGCTARAQMKEPVRFYYPRLEYEYSAPDGVITCEEREASGHKNELPYLLSLYFSGPVDENLTNPFSPDTELLEVRMEGKSLLITLTDSAQSMPDAAFALASACLSTTCFELSDLQYVTVLSGSKSLTTARDGLVLSDTYTPKK